MENSNNYFLKEVADYYSNKLDKHGETPLGVDWNGKQSQVIRFEQLCKLIKLENHFSINDLGCGYGALHEFMISRYDSFNYTGIDISKNMVLAAKKRIKNTNTRFIISDKPDHIADYSVASGIFNIREDKPDNAWQRYLETTLDSLNNTSRLGFAFNCLTSYSDADRMRDYLYYSNPGDLFNFCKQRYSRNVALLHDYNLYEFTILVKKQP